MKIKNIEVSPAAVTSALLDLRRAMVKCQQPWALIGGHALRAHGVPRDTLDVDAVVPADAIDDIAQTLIDEFEWMPLAYDQETQDYIIVKFVSEHRMDDPVLFDIGQRRVMVPLLSPMSVIVELLSAQHPVETEMIASAGIHTYLEVRLPVAPLGGVLLVKQKADRVKDIGALEQTAEHLSESVLKGAVAWARRHDPATADELESTIRTARFRRGTASIKEIPKKK